MMDALTRWWRQFRGGGNEEFTSAPSADADLRDRFLLYSVRLAGIFLLLFSAVFGVFRWSGAAVRFGALQTAGAARPTWRVKGVVRDSRTGDPVPWARLEDDSAGGPPLFLAEADQRGDYELLTLAKLHQVRVSVPNYLTTLVHVGRICFLWMPREEEYRVLKLDRIGNSTLR